MKKRVFSSLLVAMFAMASVGMFVSCKDYDDDINAVNDDVASLRSELETVKSDLQDELTTAKGEFAAQIEQAIAGKADESTVQELYAMLDARVSALETQISAVNEALESLTNGDLSDALNTLAALTGRIDDVEDKVGAVEANLQLQIDALNAFKSAVESSDYGSIEGLLDAIQNAEATIKAIQSSVSANSSAIDDLRKQMEEAEEAMQSLDEVISGLNGSINVLEVLLDKMLSSLVFSPVFYYGGIAAMEATTINYVPIQLDGNSTVSSPTATGETWTYESYEASLTPAVTASYHMNPSYFDVSKIKSMSVVSDDKDYVAIGSTRTAESNPTIVDGSWLNSTGGMLTVTLDLDASKLMTSEDKVTVLAVQAHLNDKEGNDTTVTSDYAAVAQSTITGVTIADTDVDDDTDCPTLKKFHVFTKASEAIANVDDKYIHELVYDDKTGVDLTKIVEAHFIRNSSSSEQKMENVSNYGMRWEFALSHYTAGTNKTSESLHASLKGNNIVACTVDENGNSLPDTQNKSSIGRLPLLRVTLVDTTKTENNIVAIGYIKFKITEKEVAPTNPDPVDIEFGNTDGVALSCDNYTYTQTWAEVEAKVLSTLDMSKENFESIYSVEKIGSGSECQLYQRENGDRVKSDNYGTVTELVNTGSHETSVLEWVVTGSEIYSVVWNADDYKYEENMSIETGVKFASSDNTVYPDVYVWFNTGIISVPTAKWSDTDKITEYWASKNGAMGSGYAEIHNNVEVVGQPGADDEFVNDILSTIAGNDITLAITGSDSFKSDELTYTFKFIIGDYETLVGQSGTEYIMSTSSDGQILYASMTETGPRQEVAKLQTSYSDVTSIGGLNSIVTYEKTDYALDILNAVSHNDIANTATATVGIYAVNGCDMELPIENNEFDIKFLRPIDATGANSVEFVDAIDGGNQIDMFKLVNFKDWRDLWEESYISYYGVETIAADVDGITTTLNGGQLGVTKLSEVTDAIKFEYVSTGASTTYGGVDFGYLKYDNNGQVVTTFQIRVPLTITYDWGEIKTAYVDITVKPTQANKSIRY